MIYYITKDAKVLQKLKEIDESFRALKSIKFFFFKAKNKYLLIQCFTSSIACYYINEHSLKELPKKIKIEEKLKKPSKNMM